MSVSTSGAEAEGDSYRPSISPDGRYVAFISEATNLAATGGSNQDVFVRDHVLGTTTLVTADAAGAGGSNSPYRFSFNTSISADGRRIAFVTSATNLGPGDSNGTVPHVYVHDLADGLTLLASVDANGVAVDDCGWQVQFSGDGNVVALKTTAQSLPNPPPGGVSTVYAKELATGAIERVDVGRWPLRGVLQRRSLRGERQRPNARHLHPRPLARRDDARGRRNARRAFDLRGAVRRFSGAGGGFEYEAGFLSADGGVLVFDTFTPEFAPNGGNGDLDLFVRVRVRVRDLIPATTVHDGDGFPGRFGVVPTLTPDHDPWSGAPLDLHVTNPSGVPTVACLLYGAARDSVPTQKGGTLLVDPIDVLAFPLGPSGGSCGGELPPDWWANGLVLDPQVLELDPWAWRGVSFTEGVELTLGDG